MEWIKHVSFYCFLCNILNVHHPYYFVHMKIVMFDYFQPSDLICIALLTLDFNHDVISASITLLKILFFIHNHINSLDIALHFLL